MKKELAQLERDTATYFENMSEEEARAERELEAALCSSPKPDVDAPDQLEIRFFPTSPPPAVASVLVAAAR
jgi:hypothetical protein